MRRSKRSFLLMLVTASVALLLSTWGTGVSLAQEHDMDHGDHGDHSDPGPTTPEPTMPEPTMPEPTTPEPTTPGPTTPDPGGDSEECSVLAELFGLCTGSGGGQEEECGFLAELFGLCTPAGGGPEEGCDFFAVIAGECNVDTESCDSYGFFEWLTHHECHGHV